jgi:type I restriction enzyme S subunit
MSAWRECKLGDLLQVKHGFAFLGEHFTSAGTHVVLTPGNFLEEGGFKEKVDKAKWYNGPIPEDYVLDKGDLIVAMTEQAEGLLGSSALIPRSGVYLHNQRLGLVQIRDRKLADQHFIYYLFNSKPVRQQIRGSASGTKIRHTAPSRIADVKVTVPPLLVQQRIAGILSAYDELIENSQRRIKILESMARALYREWFVHFRFPGHENQTHVASPLGEIPQGWEVKALGAQLTSLESGKRPKGGIRDVEDGVPSIGAENINGIGRHDFAGEKFIPREFFQEMRKGIVRDRDVAIYKDGAYIGKSSYFRDGFPHAECCVNEHVFLLRADGVRLKQNALYLWLQEPDTVQTIRSKNASAAQPGINQQTVGGLEVVLPDEKTAAYFDQLVDPLLAEIINLAKKVQNLRRTRDLLLPRLLSGQIEVQAIPEGVAA